MDSKQELFAAQLYRLRTARRLSGRKLGARADVEPSLISRLENNKASAGPVTIEKLANGMELAGDERNSFVKAGIKQSARTAQAFSPRIPNPFFRGVLCDLLHTLGIKGQVRGFEAEVGAQQRHDLVVTMMDGTIHSLNFKPGKILVTSDDAMDKFPAPTEAAVLAHGGLVAELNIRRGVQSHE